MTEGRSTVPPLQPQPQPLVPPAQPDDSAGPH